jgi:flavin-dependent dehydrogenase
MITHLADRAIKETATPGFIINRDVFDQTLAKSACDNGAQILLSAKAISRNGTEVIIKTKDSGFITVSAKVIIGADGPLSTVGKWIGCVNQNLIAAVQVRVSLKHRLESAEIYFDADCYGGYAWLFPKDKVANLGLGMKKKNNAPLPFRQLLDRLISRRASEGKIIKESSGLITGWIPVGPLPKIVHKNIILAGDAAGHTHPITGAGIFSAVTCGHLAGKWAARAIDRQDLTVLHEYEKECFELFGDTLKRAAARRQLLEQNWDQLDKILKFCWIAFKEYYA